MVAAFFRSFRRSSPRSSIFSPSVPFSIFSCSKSIRWSPAPERKGRAVAMSQRARGRILMQSRVPTGELE